MDRREGMKALRGQSDEIENYIYGELLHHEWIGEEDCGFLIFVIIIQTVIM